MRLRRKLALLLRPERDGRLACPVCGYVSERDHGRLVDPVSERATCVRCGSEIGRENDDEA